LENPAARVDNILDRNLEATKKSNREIVRSVLGGVLTCAWNGAPLRGHRDDGRIVVEEGEEGLYEPGSGLLRSVLRYRGQLIL